MDPSETIERLNSAMSDFLVPLRMGRGFDSVKFESVCSVIEELNLEWKQEQVIPKAAAIMFLDDLTSMVACSYLYPSQTAYIQEKAGILHELVRKCCE